MSLVQWSSFVEVCRTGSIGGAAATLGYTQSAVSRQVAALEAELQVRLLERLPRGVRPTAAGTALLHHAQIVVNEAARGREAVRRAADGAVQLSIGAVPSAASTVVPAALRKLAARGPVQWSIVPGVTGDLLSMVRAGEVDLAVVTDAPPGLPSDAHVRLTHVGDDEMVVVVPAGHALAGRTRPSGLADLRDEHWLEDNAGSEALLRSMAARSGFEPVVDRAATDLPTKVGLVAAGHGVALVPGLLVSGLRADVRVVRLRDAVRRGIFVLEAAEVDGHGEFVAALRSAVGRALERRGT
jgi:DNA-binding transcriptional LysR family regulator